MGRRAITQEAHIGPVGPDALKIPARRAEYSLAESAHSPFQAWKLNRFRES